MSTEKRARKKANRRARLEAEHRASTRAGRTRLAIRVGIIGVVAVGGLLLYSWLASGDGDDEDEQVAATDTSVVEPTEGTAGTGTSTATSVAGSTDEAAVVSTTAAAAAATSEECPASDGSSERRTTFAAAPPMCIDPAASYRAEVVTSEGTFVIDLDATADEAAVNNFVFLARYHFYDGLDFHRVVPDFVIQGGDPAGDGSGGPGYQWTGGRPESSDIYTVGSVSMANSGGDPSTNGSQFFVALGDLSDQLTADYTYFGELSDGFDVAAAIGVLGEGDGPPSRPVAIESVTVTEG